MESKIYEVFCLVIRMIIRRWSKNTEAILDVAKFAEECGMQFFESKRFANSIEEFAAELAEDFVKKMKNDIDEVERREEIVRQIMNDIRCASISEELILNEGMNIEDLRELIMSQAREERELWSSKELGVYSNCIKYISKCILEFVPKLPNFTPTALQIILQRQEEYKKELKEILKEIHAVREIVKGTEVTFRNYEEAYREEIIRRYSKIELIGSGLTERHLKRYDISLAYIELECLDEDMNNNAKLSEVFSENNVVWIKGEAGTGKTTFLQWVAICSAKNDYEKVKNIRNTIPIVIKLRSIEGPLNLQAFINKFSESLGYKSPEGWLDNVLKQNRTLLLIDGLDEVENKRREEVYFFIEELIEKNPKQRVLITSRNSVVDSLKCETSHYEIIPMKMTQIKKFVKYWHRAILYKDGIEDDLKISELQKKLITKIANSRSLKALAKSPLLCAMICSLNYINNEQLPESKSDLYEKCCMMLLDSRDNQREIKNAKYDDLMKTSYSKKRWILEEIAYWMLRNGQSSVSKMNLMEFLSRLLENSNILNNSQKKCDAKTVVLYLVERSGIIREPEDGEIDFIHKTFMEFLAVRAIIRSCDFNVLIREACNPNWKETIIMCFSEMSASHIEEILNQLIVKGKKKQDHRYILLAAIASQNAIWIEPKTRESIDSQIKHMIPPNKKDIADLVQTGEYILPFLFDKKEYTTQQKNCCLRLLEHIYIEENIPNLLSFMMGNGEVSVKERTIMMLSDWCEEDLEEYNVRDQLFEVLLSESKDGNLTTYKLLLNLVGNYKPNKKQRDILKNVNTLNLYCQKDFNDMYDSSISNISFFENVKKVCIRGEIENIDFLNNLVNIEELVIDCDFCSGFIGYLSDVKTLKSVKKLVIKTKYLGYFCEQDLKNMRDLEWLEIHCKEEELEFIFNSIEKFPKLNTIILDIDKGALEYGDEIVEKWKKQRPELNVYLGCFF